ncbi:carboxypeptidase regulatory-like domain-containing protein [bacterium]|nr:carboxypeptidase regulatory-like domain-containing protein [bacterium]
MIKKLCQHWCLLAMVTFMLAVSPAKAQDRLSANYRAVFSWEVDRFVKQDIDYFILIVDNEMMFDHITNVEQSDADYALVIDNSNNQYQLIFEDDFSVGQHQWYIIGATNENEAIFRTTPAIFSVEKTNIWSAQSMLAAITRFVRTSGELLVTTLLSFGSLIFVLLFGMIFVLDVIFGRGASWFFAKHRGEQGRQKSGYVFDALSNRGVPFAILTLTGRDNNGEEVIRTAVTDMNGIYTGMTVPSGDYSLTVKRQGFTFPTRRTRADIVPMMDYYKGEEIHATELIQLIDPMVPMDRVQVSLEKERWHFDWQRHFWQRWQGWQRLQPQFEFCLLVLSLIGLYWKPSWLYILTALFYGILVIWRLIKLLRKTSLRGLVTDENGCGLPGAIVEIVGQDEDDDVNKMVISDERGEFAVSLKPGTYRLQVKKNGYVTSEQMGTVESGYTVTIGKSIQNIVLQLHPIPKMSEDFFFQKD